MPSRAGLALLAALAALAVSSGLQEVRACLRDRASNAVLVADERDLFCREGLVVAVREFDACV